MATLIDAGIPDHQGGSLPKGLSHIFNNARAAMELPNSKEENRAVEAAPQVQPGKIRYKSNLFQARELLTTIGMETKKKESKVTKMNT